MNHKAISCSNFVFSSNFQRRWQVSASASQRDPEGHTARRKLVKGWKEQGHIWYHLHFIALTTCNQTSSHNLSSHTDVNEVTKEDNVTFV